MLALLRSLFAPLACPSGASAPTGIDEARYRSIVESQQATVMRLDLTGRILLMTEYCCRFAGVRREAAIGRSYADWVHPDDRDALVAALGDLVQPPHRARGLSRVVAAGGVVRWLEWESATILDEAGQPMELQSIGRDVTERVHMEEALRVSLAELSAKEDELGMLARHQAALREEERKRLGFDLHDGVCQELVGTSIMVEDPASPRPEVRDDGRGFDPPNRHTKALGILGMEERAAALGGRLHVQSAPGRGTAARLVCPLASGVP